MHAIKMNHNIDSEVMVVVEPVPKPRGSCADVELTKFHSPCLHQCFNSLVLNGRNPSKYVNTTQAALYIFADWLASGSLGDGITKLEIHHLIDLWSLARQLRLPKLQNAVIYAIEDARMAGHHNAAHCNGVYFQYGPKIYDSSRYGPPCVSQLRKLLAAQVALFIDSTAIVDFCEGGRGILPVELLADVARLQKERDPLIAGGVLNVQLLMLPDPEDVLVNNRACMDSRLYSLSTIQRL